MKIETMDIMELKVKRAALMKKFKEFVNDSERTKSIDFYSFQYYTDMLKESELKDMQKTLKGLYLHKVLHDE